jgi:ATP-binding cassette, subfamily C, bacterial CydC
VGSQSVTAPVFAVLVLVPLAIFESLAAVPVAITAGRIVTASAKRIEDSVPDSLPLEIPEEITAAPRVGLGELALDLVGVQASWPGAQTPALRPVTVGLVAGDRVAVSGPSGSGKSTLANVLVRFLEHTGDYTLCGVDVRSIPLDQVRETVVLCEQRPHLFSTSIRHNLSFAKPEGSDEEFLDVLDRVGLGSWVESRGGLDASVGERGALVSGGQAQRIALARALLSEAPIIVFDEPTANVERALSDHLMRDLLHAGSEGSQRIVMVMSHTPVPEDLITQRLVLEPE